VVLRTCTGVSPNRRTGEKLKFLLKHDLLYKFGMKHETYLVIKAAYPLASDEDRRSFLRSVLAPSSSETRPYAIYNLLYWLTTVAPDCKQAREEFDTYSASHPEYGPREHLDMDAMDWAGYCRVAEPLQTAAVR